MKYKFFVLVLVAVAWGAMPMAAADDNKSAADATSAVGQVDTKLMERMPDLQLSNTLQGQAAGLIAIGQSGDLGANGAALYIRGLHNIANSQALVIIDGLERNIDDLLPEEIETVSILKDAPAKILYGPRAANGVILITTKRGEARRHQLRVGLEYGIQNVGRMPKFLGAADYVKLFNEACMNDELAPRYSQTDLNGYANSKGENDLLYPNVDYYDRFLNDQGSYRKATVQIDGGNKDAVYAVMVGYTGSSGIEKVTDRTNLNRLNARGNLNVRINDLLSVYADVAARIDKQNRGVLDGGELFGQLSTLRPCEYPFVILPTDVDGHDGYAVDADAQIYGASERRSNNLFAQMSVGGNRQQRYVATQTNLGSKFDFDKYVKGLTAQGGVSFDNYSLLNQQQSNNYPTYSVDRYIDASGNTVTRFTQRQLLNLPKKQAIISENTYRSLGWHAQVNYVNIWADVHSLTANLAYNYALTERTGTDQDIKHATLSGRFTYSFADRLMANLTIADQGSNRLSDHFLATAIGASWVLKKESFLSDVDAVDDLRLKASYGVLGYDGTTSYFLDRTNWVNAGRFEFKPSTGADGTSLSRIGNNHLKWESSHEFNIGIEGRFLKGRLAAELNYFTELRKNIIGNASTLYSGVAGYFIPQENIGEVKNQGVELDARWRDVTKGGLTYEIGANLTFTKNKVNKANELWSDEYRQAVGHSTSTIFGLQDQGLFGRDISLDGHAVQTFGNYGVGDIAYADQNGDNVLDEADLKSIGQTFPTTTVGLHAELRWHGWGFYVLGTLATGLTDMLNNAYYWNKGVDAYSELALDRYHPTNNPNGSQPRLTTKDGGNNYLASTFWAENGSFFRLRNIELSYTLDARRIHLPGTDWKLFVRGANLLTLSAVKDLDPECLNAGVTNYPMMRTFTAGLAVTF